MIPDLISAIAHVNSGWSLAAFAIAAFVVIWKYLIATKRAGPSNSIVWGAVLVICFLGGLPIMTRAYIEHERMKYSESERSVFRVRTLVLDPQGVPTSGAILRSTASNQTATDSQGIGEIAIYRATMPSDGKVTIYADLNAEFLHGQADIVLEKDQNPSLTIQLKADGSATVVGIVEDQGRHAISDAIVTVVGGETRKTASDGTFILKTNAAVGQPVRLHVEKKGCEPIDQEHPAGRGQAAITLVCHTKSKQTR